MRINGEWRWSADGIVRPIVWSELLGLDGDWYQVPFLIDTGADQTVLSQAVYRIIGLAAETPQVRLAGAGGAVSIVGVDLNIRLVRDDGQTATFRGKFAACTDPQSLDMSVLGRDVLDHFALIIDRSADLVTLITGNHSYTIRG